jgi:hypothetical protein
VELIEKMATLFAEREMKKFDLNFQNNSPGNKGQSHFLN